MRKGLLALVLGFCLWGAGLAVELPEGELVVTLADGTVVGVGEFAEGGLALQLVAGTSGFATVTVIGVDGVVVSFEVVVGEDGSLTVVESFEDLAASIVAGGGEVEVSFEEDVALKTVEGEGEEGVEHATGLDRADERASERAAAGLARARAARDGAVAAEGELEDAEDAEDAAEEAEEAAERAAEEAERAAEEAEQAAERAADEAEEAAEVEEEDDGESDDEGEAAGSRAADRGGRPQGD